LKSYLISLEATVSRCDANWLIVALKLALGHN